ncbi:hypothetical protein [Phascolarctobacterium sp.]|uniref:hypothetical protein n=1 Tax=Phascolarctobacterium sp. TaxID=2049039 RepID=UPI00386CBE08
MEEKKNNWGGVREGAGRPKLGVTSKMRSLRMTDDEYDMVRRILKEYRAGARTFTAEDDK